MRSVPRLASLTLAFALQLRKSRENLSQSSQGMLLPITNTHTITMFHTPSNWNGTQSTNFATQNNT
jgi:hypothetical protein